jgi:hypothetical protein
MAIWYIATCCTENSSVDRLTKYLSSDSGTPRIFFFWGGVVVVQQIQLRIEGRENRDLGAVAP